MLPQALRPTPGSLLLLSLAPGLAVITNQGRGGEQDYVMTLAQANKRKQAASTNQKRLDLFTPGVVQAFGHQENFQNLTYYQRTQSGLPRFVMGMYILLADDTEPGYHTDNAAWQPLLHP